MKHAGPAILDLLEPLLQELRTFPQLKEKKRGTFYRKSDAFLHFHEDPAGIFADLKLAGSFQRFPADSLPSWRELVQRVKEALAE